MATIDTDHAFAGTGSSGLIARITGALRDWNDARITRRALSRLSARELDDIGLCRGDIDSIATRGARRPAR
jgi:uncharacterized protein YjiS (DUF1127 family)